MADEGSLRIEIALRAGMIAKAALEMINLDPRLVPLQIQEVAEHLSELREKVSLQKGASR